MCRKKTHDKFVEEVRELGKFNYKVIGTYKNNKTKIKIQHIKCNHIYLVKPSVFLSGRRCPNCFKKVKKTHSQFLEEVNELVQNEYTFLEKYINRKEKIRVKHNNCNHVYTVSPGNFLQGYRCPNCFKKVKKTHSQFLKEINKLVQDEYIFLEKYINSEEKIKVRHNLCKYEYEVRPNDFLRGSRCPNCYGNTKKTHQQFISEVSELVGNEYTFLETYVNSHTKIKVRHNLCKYDYLIEPVRFLSGSRCANCNGNLKKTHEQFVSKVNELVGNEYTFLEEYTNRRKKLLVRHNQCHNTYTVTPGNFLYGYRCPNCFGSIKRTHSQFLNEVLNLVGNEYEVLGDYKNSNTKIEIKHNKCGHVYLVMPSKFFSGQRCPLCKESKGELEIKRVLEKLKLKYSVQFRINECRNNMPLPFDFAIFKKDTLLFLIEYDGRQHYEPVEYFGGSNSFKKQQKNDLIKTNFCKQKNIRLLRIPYWEFNNIETTLTNFYKNLIE